MIAITHPQLQVYGAIGKLFEHHGRKVDTDGCGHILAIDDRLACTLLDYCLAYSVEWTQGPLPDSIALKEPINLYQLESILIMEC